MNSKGTSKSRAPLHLLVLTWRLLPLLGAGRCVFCNVALNKKSFVHKDRRQDSEAASEQAMEPGPLRPHTLANFNTHLG